jgi:2',3'-cyclic-nucleotide 2'-phosphodiesterase (5'-nucleotidase family)
MQCGTGGHEHTPFFIVHSGTTIIKCGQNLDHLGILDLSFSRNEVNEIKTIFSFKLLSTADTATNETIDSVIHKWISSIPEEEGAGEILCTVGEL